MSLPHLVLKWYVIRLANGAPDCSRYHSAQHTSGYDKHNCLGHSHRASSDRDYLGLQGYHHAHNPSLSQSEPERTTWKHIIGSPPPFLVYQPPTVFPQTSAI
jgi:hypothetical protein